MSLGRKYPESLNISFWILSRIWTSLMHILSFVDVHHIRWNINPIYIMKTIYCIRIWATFLLLSCLCSVNVLRAKIPESLNISFWILSRIWTSLMHILSFVDTHHIRSNINPVYIMKTIYCTRIRATFLLWSCMYSVNVLKSYVITIFF